MSKSHADAHAIAQANEVVRSQIMKQAKNSMLDH
jgi:hypothetical protein|tara:strand:- start:7543 stop:7644 length:102 start_codon:yes stop_codon:yes gene_type:complete